jgi:hypothetical protein
MQPSGPRKRTRTGTIDARPPSGKRRAQCQLRFWASTLWNCSRKTVGLRSLQCQLCKLRGGCLCVCPPPRAHPRCVSRRCAPGHLRARGRACGPCGAETSATREFIAVSRSANGRTARPTGRPQVLWCVAPETHRGRPCEGRVANQNTRLGDTRFVCYTLRADVEICDGLRNLCSAACHRFIPQAPALTRRRLPFIGR